MLPKLLVIGVCWCSLPATNTASESRVFAQMLYVANWMRSSFNLIIFELPKCTNAGRKKRKNNHPKDMSDIIIRKALPGDCPRILELVRELAAYERAPHEVTVTLEHFTDSGFGLNPVWWAFVAVTIDPVTQKEISIDGFALYYIRFSTWKGQRMYLEDILVTDAMRGKGIGFRLFDALQQEAKEKKLNAIVWQVLEWNEPAIHFYKKLQASFDHEWVNCALTID